MNDSYIQLLVNMVPQDLKDLRMNPGSVVQIIRICPICEARFQTPIPSAISVRPDDIRYAILRTLEWQKKATRDMMLDHIETEHPLEIAKAALRLIVE